MKQLISYLEAWEYGEVIKGINVTLSDIREVQRIVSGMTNKERIFLINGNVKNILDLCKIKTVPDGIGWVVL